MKATNCKIYNLSSINSAPPYFINGYEEQLTEHMCAWKDKYPHWREIGKISSIEIARIMILQDLAGYTDGNKIKYSLKTFPSDEYYCDFVKIESTDSTEYYDIYNQSHKFKARNLTSVSSNYDFSTALAFEKLRSPIWEIEKAFTKWRRDRQNFSVIFNHKKFTKKDRQTQKKYAADFRKELAALINKTETAISLLKDSRPLEKYEIERINGILDSFASSFALIYTGHNDYPYKNKKNVSLKKYKKLVQKLYMTVAHYNSRHSTKLDSLKIILNKLSEKWDFMQSTVNEKNIKTATRKLAEKNLKLKELFSETEKLADSLISDFWKWKELHSPDDFTCHNTLTSELQQQDDSQFQETNDKINRIQQHTNQILSLALSFVVIDPLNYKEIENSFFAITSAINTFVSLYQNNIDKYQKLNKINIKSLKKSKSKLQVVMDYHIQV